MSREDTDKIKMKYFVLAVCFVAVAFAAPSFRRGGPPSGDKPSKEDVEELIALCEDLKDDKRGDEPTLDEMCRELGKLLEKGPKPTDASKRKLSDQEAEDGAMIIVAGMNSICIGFGELVEAYERLDGASKRSWDAVLGALGEVCKDLHNTQMAELDANKDGELQRDELDRASTILVSGLVRLCEGVMSYVENMSEKRSWESTFTGLIGVCMKTQQALLAQQKRKMDDKPTKEEVEELIALCEALKDDDKRQDEPELEEVCRELGKMLKKGPRPTEAARGGGGRRPKPTDEDGNTLPPPNKDDMPTKEEVEELIALCEALKDDDKRQDEPELEDVCRELGKMLKNGPRPTEAARGGGGRRPKPTDEDGNTLPPPNKDDMPTKEEVEELIALCEALKDDDKRQDEPELEDVCRELGKMLKKGPRPTEAARGGGGRRPKPTDEDGNTLPPPNKDDMPTKEEVEELIALCETLKDDDKRQDEPELEDVCRELGKMLKKGPRPTEATRGKRPTGAPKTDDDGNFLPKPDKDMPTMEEVEELIAVCEMLADDDKRDDEPELEEVCKELAKMLE